MSIITISRGTYSGGQALAERVAQRLGAQCVSREQILETAARTYSYPTDKLASEMDSVPSFWDRLSGMRTSHHIYVRAAILEFARQEPMVYHGYVGHLHLVDLPHVLRVRAIADLEYRTHAVMEERKITKSDAIALIKKADKERRDWVRFLFGVEWDDPAMYDLVVNLGRMRLETACEMVANAAEREEFRSTVQSTKTVNDLALASRVSATLVADPRTATDDVVVSADSGVVTLEGLIWTKETVDAMLEIAGGVEGVTEISNRFKVVPPERYSNVD